MHTHIHMCIYVGHIHIHIHICTYIYIYVYMWVLGPSGNEQELLRSLGRRVLERSREPDPQNCRELGKATQGTNLIVIRGSPFGLGRLLLGKALLG